MQKRLFKGIVLLVIFGVPVFWYLFLQLFGENTFELKPLRKIDAVCIPSELSIILTDAPVNVSEENQLARLKDLIGTREVNFHFDSLNCIPDSSANDLYLVDQDNFLRGHYSLTILEIDRLIVELDLVSKLSNVSDSK